MGPCPHGSGESAGCDAACREVSAAPSRRGFPPVSAARPRRVPMWSDLRSGSNRRRNADRHGQPSSAQHPPWRRRCRSGSPAPGPSPHGGQEPCRPAACCGASGRRTRHRRLPYRLCGCPQPRVVRSRSRRPHGRRDRGTAAALPASGRRLGHRFASRATNAACSGLRMPCSARCSTAAASLRSSAGTSSQSPGNTSLRSTPSEPAGSRS